MAAADLNFFTELLWAPSAELKLLDLDAGGECLASGGEGGVEMRLGVHPWGPSRNAFEPEGSSGKGVTNGKRSECLAAEMEKTK
jgi:hypothetical protein